MPSAEMTAQQSSADKAGTIAPPVPTINRAAHWLSAGLCALGNPRLAGSLVVPMILLDRIAAAIDPPRFTQAIYLLATGTCLQTFFAWSRYFELDRNWALAKRLRIFPYMRLAPACVPIAVSSVLVGAGELLLPDHYRAWLPAVVWTLVGAEQFAPFFSIRAALLEPTASHLLKLFLKSGVPLRCAPAPLIVHWSVTGFLLATSTYLYFVTSTAVGSLALASTAVISIGGAVAAVHDYEPFDPEHYR